jgi:NAD(P) transhydrogenase subunit beta
MSANLVALCYLAASVCFILALKGLSSPVSARRGNAFGIAGMTIAVVTTLAIVAKGRIDLILVAMVIGGTIGAFV